jgi:PIN domain nuclease of toxin-antitoxin system
MKVLLDTHILLWAAGQPEKLSAEACALLNDPANELLFSAASMWEIVIKQGLGREDFQVAASQVRRGLVDNGYHELSITSDHALAIEALPPLHKDPFDRILIAQAKVEGILLLTSDSLLSQYPGPVRQV